MVKRLNPVNRTADRAAAERYEQESDECDT
jgi:hypothetical protein